MPAYFCTCTEVPEGYYNIWVRDTGTEEYWQYFTNLDIADKYTLVLVLDTEDKEFEEYMASLHKEEYEETFFPGRFRRIDDLGDAQNWLAEFPAWKQERERLRREHWLNEYYQKTKDKEHIKQP